MEPLALGIIIILLLIGGGVVLSLAQRIRRLEDQVYGRGVQAPATVHEPAAPSEMAPAPSHPPTTPERKTGEWETQMGAKWFTAVGAVAVLFGVGFFLRYAFEQNLISPAMRVALGAVAGVVSIGIGTWLRRKYAAYGHSLMGLGLGIFYLTLYASLHAYQFLSEPAAFAGMVVVTALGFLLAFRLKAEPLAILALLGGLLTPMLVGSDNANPNILFPYLALLDIAILVLALFRNWKSITPIALAGTVVVVGWWQAEFGTDAGWVLPQAFTTLYFLFFAAAGLLRYVRKAAEHTGYDMAVSAANLLAYAGLTWFIVPDQYQIWIGWLFVALGAAYLLVSLTIPHKQQKDQQYRDTLAISGMALVTVAPWIIFEKDALVFFMAGVVALLGTWIAVQGRSKALRLVIALSYAFHSLFLFITLFNAPATGTVFFLNGAFWWHLLFILSLGATVYWTGKAKKEDQLSELHDALFIIATVLGVTLISTELSALVGATALAAKGIAVSLTWTVYALILLTFGIVTKSSVGRKTALALFGAAILKVFLYDTAVLENQYRFISFMTLGVILLLCGYLYHRFRDRIRKFISE